MLTTARQLAAGLGAPPSKSQDPQLHGSDGTAMGTTRKVGNAPLGLWIGQRFLGELFMVATVCKKPLTMGLTVSQNCTVEQEGINVLGVRVTSTLS